MPIQQSSSGSQASVRIFNSSCFGIFFFNHWFLKYRMSNHLIKCRRSHGTKGTKECRFDTSHIVPEEEIKVFENSNPRWIFQSKIFLSVSWSKLSRPFNYWALHDSQQRRDESWAYEWFWNCNCSKFDDESFSSTHRWRRMGYQCE